MEVKSRSAAAKDPGGCTTNYYRAGAFFEPGNFDGAGTRADGS